MHQIDDAVVRGGKLILSDLPFAEGRHVRIVVSEVEAPAKRVSILEIRRLLKGGVDWFEDPLVPMIPAGNWEMLK